MLKEKKLEFQQTLEEYLEQQKLYEVFESLMKSLITQKPADPIEHLIKKLEQPESKFVKQRIGGVNRPLLCFLVLRIDLLRPPGSRGKEIALSLAEYLSE